MARTIDLRKSKAQVEITNPGDIGLGGLSSVVTQISASTTVVTLASTNADRVSVTIHNQSTNTMWVKYGTGASTTSFTAKLYKGDVYFIDDFRGTITGIWNGTDSFAQITEVS